MIEIYTIKICEIIYDKEKPNVKPVIAGELHKWEGISRKVDNVKALKRYRALLKWVFKFRYQKTTNVTLWFRDLEQTTLEKNIEKKIVS